MTIPTIPRINRAMKSLRRGREIVRVLLKHGFAETLSDSGLAKWAKDTLEMDLFSVSPEEQKLSRNQRIRRVIEDLGPTFIKIGQILSTRPDLLPIDLVDELKKLQSDVAPVPFEKINDALLQEFGDRLSALFTFIDPKPLGSASLAQTHRARLNSGETVVLKILRPGIRSQLEADIAILREIARLTESQFSNLGFSPLDVCAEFTAELERETDYFREATSTERLSALFLSDPGVRFPRVYRHASTSNVLALEEVEGILISHSDPSSIDPKIRRKAVENATRAVFKQCLEYGFFHADPHPGNIFILPDGAICFVDCGMTGHLEERTSQDIARLCSGIVTSDLDEIIEVVRSLTSADPGVMRSRSFRNDLWQLVSQFQHGTLESLNIGALLSEFFSLLRRYHIRCPSDLVYLIKALTTIEAVAASLDPSFDLIDYVYPYLEQLIRKRYGPGAIARRTRRSMAGYFELLEDLPKHLQNLIDQLLNDRFQVHLEHRGLHDLTDTLVSVGRKLSSAVTLAALLVGSSILILADNMRGDGPSIASAIGAIGYAISSAAALSSMIAFWRGR